MNTTQTGRKAEIAASNYLVMRGYKILERNWRRPSCEIDIIATKDNQVFFVEVKYRASDNQGGGLEALTASKIKQMKYAAWTWVEESKWKGSYYLSAIEVGSKDFQILSFIDDLII